MNSSEPIGFFKTNSNVKSTKELNLRMHMLDEWKVHSYMIIPSILLKRVEK